MKILYRFGCSYVGSIKSNEILHSCSVFHTKPPESGVLVVTSHLNMNTKFSTVKVKCSPIKTELSLQKLIASVFLIK